MSELNADQAIVLYKSPKSVTKGISLRERYAPASTGTVRTLTRGGYTGDHPIRLSVSSRPGSWEYIKQSFESLSDAMEVAEQLEAEGLRVTVEDWAARG